MAQITLPQAAGGTERYTLAPPSRFAPTHAPSPIRTVYAAAHVVADPRALNEPWRVPAVDWDATLAFRRHLWGLGFKVAEAMDTSQRGMGLDWSNAAELIARVLAEAKTVEGADLACGAGTDQLDPNAIGTLDDVIRAYEEQIAHVETHGGKIILMASRALCRVAKGPDDYLAVYSRLIRQCRGKVILHWLGEMFDPALAGYWGSREFQPAMAAVLTLIRDNAAKIDGIKISLLDAGKEIEMRRKLPDGIVMYSGDDFNYAELIAGDEHGFSHGLLGIFDPIAPAAAAAFARLEAGDKQGFHAILDPTVALSRRLFEAPTQYYKSGVVLLAWLNGFQDHFRMIGGAESARGILHYADLFRLADRAGLFTDPERAARRMGHLCALNGIA
ncbi:dihydrodipicolinate synthase family protein [Bosea caraganae]|uniref:Dihydrodipicolinate synthase family protein n=1 Tax=Bosea caraganae TaxID=2763117 RepID=A0A370KYD6_9HYPH|nr:dihydrodipicolinate synthase family protein [Bosea caraganae]RDJ20009.1 dihydrodipicolinate synthase family protein [Bosea caraganae]RDJ23920.1 dihydrodipicolinate synthase family protein [Bosea caraganae]